MNRVIVFILFCCSVFTGVGQSEYSYYEADSSFVYKDGFYRTIKDFRNNTPLEPNCIIAEVRPIDPNFFKEVVSKQGFRYRQNDSIKSAAVDDLFGYCINGDPYMNMGNGDFARMATVGSLCFIPVNQSPQVSPSVGFGASSWGGAGMGVGINIGPPAGPKEVILSVKDEVAAELTTETLLKFLEADPPLADEYRALKRKDQRKQKYLYIQKFNERNPLR
jgi:hypothetical protein